VTRSNMGLITNILLGMIGAGIATWLFGMLGLLPKPRFGAARESSPNRGERSAARRILWFASAGMRSQSCGPAAAGRILRCARLTALHRRRFLALGTALRVCSACERRAQAAAVRPLSWLPAPDRSVRRRDPEASRVRDCESRPQAPHLSSALVTPHERALDEQGGRGVAGYRNLVKMITLARPRRHCEEAKPTKQSRAPTLPSPASGGGKREGGLLRGACHRTARSADPFGSQ
jgi:hypothetical protein